MKQRYLICTFVLILGALGLFAQETLADKKKQATNYYYLNKYQSAQSVLIGIKKTVRKTRKPNSFWPCVITTSTNSRKRSPC